MKEITLDKFTEYTFLHGLSWNPSGTVLAVIRDNCDMESNGYKEEIWIDRGKGFSFLLPIGSSKSFFWKDDRTIVYPERKSEWSTTFTAVDIETKEKKSFPTLHFSVRELERLSSGRYAAVARIDIENPDYYKAEEEDRRRIDEKRKSEEGFVVIDELPIYSNGESYVSGKRNAIFIFSLETGEAERITPPLFFVDYFTTEGDTIFYAGEEYRHVPTLSRKIYSYSDGVTRLLNADEKLNVTGLSVLDGTIMMFGNRFTPYGRRKHRIFYSVDKESGELTVINDRDSNMMNSVVTDSAFGGGRSVKVDGDRLYFVTTIGHSSYLARTDREGSVEYVVEKEGSIEDFDVKDGKISVIAFYDGRLEEVYSVRNGVVEKTSSFNDEVLSGYYIAAPEPLIFTSHSHEIEGWVLPPKDYEKGKKYPAILDIHGGPNFVYGTGFFHEMQLWASRGYFVFFCNPEGSEGHGDAFMDIAGRYGKEDYETLMSFTDKVLEKYEDIDPRRLAVTGGSYGGFMTNWIVGHTDRFAVAATQRSICNWVSMAGTGDHGYHFCYDQTRGDVAEDPEKMWEQSPLKYVKNVKTPTLVFHSDRDYRCPLEQGLQWYAALRRRGVETRLCIVSGENHGLSRGGRPRQRIRRLEEITSWIEKHIGGDVTDAS